MQNRSLKILAVSSGGGHWIQLMRLQPVMHGAEVVYACVNHSYQCDVAESEFYIIKDGNLGKPWRLFPVVCSAIFLVARVRPDVLISTGAAPGFLAACIAKIMGARVVWIDSIANAEELSMCGRHIGWLADLWLTQWPHLTRKNGPQYL